MLTRAIPVSMVLLALIASGCGEDDTEQEPSFDGPTTARELTDALADAVIASK